MVAHVLQRANLDVDLVLRVLAVQDVVLAVVDVIHVLLVLIAVGQHVLALAKMDVNQAVIEHVQVVVVIAMDAWDVQRHVKVVKILVEKCAQEPVKALVLIVLVLV